YLVNDLCVLSQRPDVYGAIDHFAGQLSVFDARFGPCYRCVFPNPPAPELPQSGVDHGVMGVVPGVIGSLQAAEVIKLALQVGQPLFGSLLLYDALGASFQTVRLSKLETCRVCGSAPLITHL
ncbi:molybdenum cofactor biosynthesis protein MoeB, partial [bacterium]|nr:molybdenum cofactor biosynthesis protein MoeB [bacterium]